MKRVDAGAHLPAHRVFEPAKCPDDRADYCLGYETRLQHYAEFRKFIMVGFLSSEEGMEPETQ